MTLQAVARGMYYPPTFMGSPNFLWGNASGVAFQTMTIDAAAEKIALMGYIHWDGAPAGAKTVGSASKIHFRTGTVTFADASTNLRIGLQDVTVAGANTQMTPDGTFDVYADIAGNSGTITSSDDNVVKSITLSTSGSKSVTHGDLIAVVFDMTARGGTDSLQVAMFDGSSLRVNPACANYTGTWSSVIDVPSILIEADDGTLGTFAGSPGLWSALTTNSLTSSASPDEQGIAFTVPFRCKVDSVIVPMGNSGSSAADFKIRLCSDPLGTPTDLVTKTVTGDEGNGANTGSPSTYLITETTLEVGTTYGVSIEATSTGNVRMCELTLSSAAHRSVVGLGNVQKIHRTNASGAFTGTTTGHILIGVGISALDDGAGGSGGGGPLIGGRLVA